MSDWLVEPHYPSHRGESGESLVEQYPWLRRYQSGRRLLPTRYYLCLKRALDIALTLLTLPLWLPLMGVIAVLIKLQDPSGEVIFIQERTGKGGRRFGMLKFRTMVVNAEEMKAGLAHLNELQWPDFKIADDPRVTRVGKFLRRTSLDELPQLINVLRGEMSLVGPRPTSFSAETYSLWQTERLDVVPGITGLWQLLGRGETEFDERLRMDIAYIERRSLLFDMEILVRTIFAVLQHKGAY